MGGGGGLGLGKEREGRRKGMVGVKKKSPDTSDFTSQPVKEESERAVKPSSSPQAACKVEILPFTFGQMQGSYSGVCMCANVCVRVRAGSGGL